ncbi:MAG: PDZ domain-containing protein [Opitutus sp.]
MKPSRAVLFLACLCAQSLGAAPKSSAPKESNAPPLVLQKMVVPGKRLPSGWFTIEWECKGTLPLDPIKRAWVSNLMPGSPAEMAGVQIGDRLIAIDGVPVRKMNGMGLRLLLDREHEPGSQIEFLLQTPGEPERVFLLTFERAGGR